MVASFCTMPLHQTAFKRTLHRAFGRVYWAVGIILVCVIHGWRKITVEQLLKEKRTWHPCACVAGKEGNFGISKRTRK